MPEERQRQGVVLALPIFQNVSLPSLERTSHDTASSSSPASSTLARYYAERLDLRASSLSQDVGTLSGGNQQKVVIGKWLATEPAVIILDEPTKGIDVGSKAAVHAFMARAGRRRASPSIMVSSELPEILGMSDRVVVMREGPHRRGVFDDAGLDCRDAGRGRHRQVAAEAACMRINRDICCSRAIVVVDDRRHRLHHARPSSQPGNLVGLFNDTAILIMLALGQMTVILTRCIDLSVAPTSRSPAWWWRWSTPRIPEVPIPLLIVIAPVIGLVLGAFNGAHGVAGRHPADRRDPRHAHDLPRPRLRRLGRHIDRRPAR